jgi:hypothetical protein
MVRVQQRLARSDAAVLVDLIEGQLGADRGQGGPRQMGFESTGRVTAFHPPVMASVASIDGDRHVVLPRAVPW